MMEQVTNSEIVVYSTSWCPDCHRSKHFLDEHGIFYIERDVEKDEEAMVYVKQVNGGQRKVPTIVFPDGSILVEPSDEALAAKLGISPSEEKPDF